MRPTRRSQPYRRGSPFRRHGPAMRAMLKGRTGYNRNPQDTKRTLKKAGPLGRKRRRRRSVYRRF